MNLENLLSAKSIAQKLDCSVSQVYKMRNSRELPEPDFKLFGEESPRGYRWRESTIKAYVLSKTEHYVPDEDAPPFIPIDVDKILRHPGRKAAHV